MNTRNLRWFPRVSCDHPHTFNITVMSDVANRFTCLSCGAEWQSRIKMTNRW